MCGRDGKPELGHTAQHRLEGNLGLESGQRRAETVVRALAERQVRIRRATQVQPLGLGKLDFVVVGRRDERQRQRAAWNRRPAELDVSSAKVPPAIRFTVVSWPTTRRRNTMDMSSSELR